MPPKSQMPWLTSGTGLMSDFASKAVAFTQQLIDLEEGSLASPL
jgi:hypothetical protein